MSSNTFSLTVDTTAPSAATGYAVAITAYTDDVAPQTGSFASGTSTSDTTPLLTGTVAGLAAGDVVRIYEGSTLLGTATVTGSTWSFQVTGATEGAHSYVATLADAAGNVGLSSNTFSLIVDTTAPTQTTVISNFVDDVGTIQGTFASGTTTDDAAPVLNGTFTGTLATGEVVRIYDGSTLLGNATVTGNNWTFSSDTGLVDGTTHNFHAVVADSAGNEGTSSANFTLTIDTTPPTQVATIVTYTDNVGLNQGNYASGTTSDDITPVLNGTLSAALGATDMVRIYDGSTLLGNATVTGTTWTFAGISGLLDASTHTYTAKVTDVAGNEGTVSNAFTLSVDITPPVVTAIALTAISIDTAAGLATGTASTTNSAFSSDFTTRDSTLTVSGTYTGTLAASGEFLQISADGGGTWNNVTFSNTTHTWSYLDTVQRTAAVTYQLRAVDSVGNMAGATVSQLVTVDVTAPIQSLLAPVLTSTYDSGVAGDSITTQTAVTFTSANSRKAEAGATVVLINDVNNDAVYSEGIDSILGTAVAAADGSWSISATGLATGTYHLAFMQVDAAGNRTKLSSVTDVSVVGTDNASSALTTWGDTFAQYETGGATATLGTNGLWSFFQTTPGGGGASVYNSTSLTGYTQIALPGGGRWAVGATFADFARTGYAGIVSVTTDVGNQDFWSTTNGTTYTRNTLTGNSLYYGGVAAYDKTGDGYLDFAMGDNYGNSLTFVTNTNGTLTFMNGTATSGEGRPTGVTTTIDGYAEVSGVDLENNGTVDIVEHTNANGNYALTTFKNDQSTTNTFTLATVAGVFATPYAGNTNVPVSMTWGDFNGDGYMDLYLNTGRNAGNTADSTASRIYWNNGSGGFGTGAGTAGGTATYFSDTLNGSASVAVDWNHDGKMDVIELPAYGVTASPTLYQNLGAGTFATGVSVTGTTTYGTINGAEAVDYNWDGSIDLLVYNSSGATVFVQNTNTVAGGTSLHLRIVDANGLNVLFGNTVQLYNSKGVLVSSQILNPQSGIGTNDSSGLVNFYGLNASETYTAVLVRSVNGISSDVGGQANLGGNTIESVNASWTGLVAGPATSSYVLSAESGSNTANGVFVGTGYNDTFFATAGIDNYSGSGGWANARFGTPVWSATMGEDIVDFKLAGTTGVTVNLNTTMAQNTGFNTATFSNIEGLYGSAGNDTFIASTTVDVNNVFQGRDGNDSFTVTGGGHASVLYTLLDSTDATGGNGTDTVTGFTVGNVTTVAAADVLDLTNLLVSYTGTAYVFKDTVSGKFVLDYASQGLNNYLQVSNDGTNTTVSVDLTGTGNFGAGHTLVTLSGVVTDLPTLLANDQLLVSSSNNLNSVVGVASQTTTDTTPIISGTIPYALTNGAHMEVTIGGVTYSSANGAVVVDPLNNTWYVQVPAGLATGTYDVSAVVLNTDGSVASQDISHNELSVTPAPTVTFGGAGSGDNKGTAVALGESGQWMIFSNQIIFNGIGSNSSTLGNYSSTSLTSSNTLYGNNLTQNVTFTDYNRDGHMDLLGEDSVYADGQQGWTFNGTTYAPFQVGLVDSAANNTANGTTNNPGANAYAWYGGVAAYDKNGDGFVDVVYGDNTPDDENAQGGYDSSFVVNQNGTINGFVKDSSYVSSPTAAVTPVATNTNNSTPDKEISGIDINNDGTVDIVYHGSVNTNKVGTLTSIDSSRLVVVTNSGNGILASTQIVNGVFYNQESIISQAPSMTWADFNGDGFMDLFLGVTNSASIATSMIFFNDGAGHLSATNATTTGIGTATNTYSMGDTLVGGPSLAMDWNGDGKMDIIELPQYGATGAVNLYTNNSTSTTPSFATTQLLASGAFGSGTGATFGNGAGGSVTGAIGLDLDWDGAQDLLVFTTNGVTTYVHNPTVVAVGTSLHLRIVDANGINAYYGNTVQLVDSTGKVVASQVINAQSGNQTNDSTGIVDFYGLSASQIYSVVLLKNVNGVSSDVGGVASDTTGVNGGGTLNVIENVNSTWAGLSTGAANDAYVLTAASGTNGASDVNAYSGLATGGDIIGTGYNDTFFAQTGTSAYNGGGGTTKVSGVQAWSNTDGLDIVDYKLAGSKALTVDLSNTGIQNTGYNTASFNNIEGIAGGSGNDTFTDSLADNQFEGRGGNDTFNLTHGGHDTLLYNVLAGVSADGTGGNGSDIVNGFKVGTWEGTAGTQRLDVHALLVGYTGDGSASYINNVATINASAGNIGSFLQVTQSGANTVVSIDRDGAGTAYDPTAIATLQNVHTDLATLLANHQLTVV
ncbi:beta strand repeat-containing protein [Pseudomonas yamanorum]